MCCHVFDKLPSYSEKEKNRKYGRTQTSIGEHSIGSLHVAIIKVPAFNEIIMTFCSCSIVSKHLLCQEWIYSYLTIQWCFSVHADTYLFSLRPKHATLFVYNSDHKMTWRPKKSAQYVGVRPKVSKQQLTGQLYVFATNFAVGIAGDEQPSLRTTSISFVFCLWTRRQNKVGPRRY